MTRRQKESKEVLGFHRGVDLPRGESTVQECQRALRWCVVSEGLRGGLLYGYGSNFFVGRCAWRVVEGAPRSLSIPWGRRSNETQKYVYNKNTPVTLVQYDLYMICDESAVSGGGLRSI